MASGRGLHAHRAIGGFPPALVVVAVRAVGSERNRLATRSRNGVRIRQAAGRRVGTSRTSAGDRPPPHLDVSTRPLLGRSALRGGDYPDVQRHRLGVAVEVGGVALEGERDGGETLLLRLSLGSRSATIDMKRGYPEMPVLGFVIEEELSAQRTHGEIVLQLAELLKGVPVVLGDAGERGPAEIHTVMVCPDALSVAFREYAV